MAGVRTIERVYGPYLDGGGVRKIVLLHYSDGSRKTTAYARYLLEQHLGRELSGDETADHIDGDPTNDDLSNLQVLSLADNIRKSSAGVEYVDIECMRCGATAQKRARDVRGNRKKGKAGPFCGRVCAGRWSAEQSI